MTQPMSDEDLEDLRAALTDAMSWKVGSTKQVEALIARLEKAERERDEAIRQHRQTLEHYRACVEQRDELRERFLR